MSFEKEVELAIKLYGNSTVKSQFLMSEHNVNTLSSKVESILITEPNMLRLTTPIVMMGDIHGQVHELRNAFIQAGDYLETTKLKNNYVFFGDYVDRGYYSCETIQLLMSLKLTNPDKIHLLRGNHECRSVTMTYGFYDEITRKYGSFNSFISYMNVFDALPIAAIVDNCYFCVHAGITKEIKYAEQINSLERRIEAPMTGPISGLLWSDPNEELQCEWRDNNRGAGYFFNGKAASQFCYHNDLRVICRSHQMMMDGVGFSFPKKDNKEPRTLRNCWLMTLWSCPNYCYSCKNKANILKVKDVGNEELISINFVATNIKNSKRVWPYFL